MKYLFFGVGVVAVVILMTSVFSALATPPDFDESLAAAAKNGGLLVFPKRVVFSGRQRSAELTLMNRGARGTTFRLDLLDLQMDEEGRLIPYEEDLERDTPQFRRTLKGMVRFSPRQIYVAAGERQTVRLFIRKPADLRAGEYRSHLQLRALPSTDLGPQLKDFRAEQSNSLSIRITALPAISLPVILRQGDLDATMDLRILEPHVAREGSHVMSLDLHRKGDRSVYGDIAAYWQATGGDEEILVGLAKGVAVYTSVDHRRFDLTLGLPEGLDSSGALRVTFESRPDFDGGGTSLTVQREITLP